MLVQKQYDTAIDIWSAGLTMAEAVRGFYPDKNIPNGHNVFKKKPSIKDLVAFSGNA